MLTKCIRFSLYSLIVIYGLIPIIVKLYPQIMHYVVFLHILRFPIGKNLSDVSSFGLMHSRNFYLDTGPDSTCGVWHILPQSMHTTKDEKGVRDETYFIQSLSGTKPIILYLHGNSATRGAWHRVELYKVLYSLDYHVVALDYRGYGDSSGTPSEEGVVSDAMAVYEWVSAHRSPRTPELVWGHSLGTAIATNLVSRLSNSGGPPQGLILEAPFTNMAEAALNHPFSKLYRAMPYVDYVFIQPLADDLDIYFETDNNILDVNCPILILHAEDDEVVPFHLGEKLYTIARSHMRSKGYEVRFVKFESKHGYGHKHIHLSSHLPAIIRDYVTSVAE